MKLAEPLVYIIMKDHENKLGFFKIEDNKYMICGGAQMVEMHINPDPNKHKVVTGKDVLPFIAYHNWVVETTIDYLKKSGQGGKHNTMILVKNARIENKFDYDFSIKVLVEEYKEQYRAKKDQIKIQNLYKCLVDKVL